MRADPAHRLRRVLLVGFAAILAATPAAGEGVYGTFQTQYQRLDENETLVSGNGSLRSRAFQQEFWVRTLDMHHQSYARPDLLFDSNLRYSDQAYLGRGDVTRTPMGSVRVIHPFFQILASHQPSSQTSSLSSQSGLNPNATTSQLVTTRNQESMLTGHFALPRWPQVDASWIHRRRDGAGSVGDQNTSRNLRLTLDRERWSAYGGVNDQILSSASPGAGRNEQLVWSAGGSYHYAPRRSLSLRSQYDVGAVQANASGIRRSSTVNHTGSIGGEWRPSKKLIGTASYLVRHVDFGATTNPPQTDQEGALVGRYQIAPYASVVGGGGLRTMRNFVSVGGPGVGLQKYLTSVASLEARVRRNWTMTGGLSHTTNFDPGRAAYHVETLNGTSRGQLTRRIQVDGSIQLSANSDSGAAASRYSNAWSARVQGTPLRALQLALSLRNMRSGPGLLRPNAVSRGLVADATWKPTANLQLTGQYGASASVPANVGRNSTRSLSARFQPLRQWQWYGSWTRSEQVAVISTAGQLSSRELVSSRVQYDRSRQLAMTAGVTYNDPGRALESKRIDLALTWSFGR